MDIEEGPDKKRVRALKSCLVCRQKKTKCDQIKPICSSCKKRKDPHMCHYEEPQWSVQLPKGTPESTTSISFPTSHLTHKPTYNTELQVLNERIKTLESALQTSGGTPSPSTTTGTPGSRNNNAPTGPEDNEPMSFQNNYFQVHGIPSQGALCWVSLLKKDVYLNCIHVSVSNRNRLMNQAHAHTATDATFKSKFANETDLNAKVEKKTPVTKPSLIDQIKSVLVDQKLIWVLVDKFFNSELFVVLPILNKTEFSKQLASIIGRREGGEIRWSLTRKYQLTTIGMLLILMRLTSTSLYNAGKPLQRELTEDEQYILDNPVPETVIRIAESCYSEIESFRYCKLDIFQFCLMKRHYEFFAPEECDCATATTTDGLGQMLQMAIQVGVTREPSKTGVPLKSRNLMRRLWYMVVNLDFYQLMLSGSPSIIDPNCFDTEFPHLDESETPLEYQTDKTFIEKNKLYEICLPLLKLILNVRQCPTLGEVKKHLRPVEEYMANLPGLDEIMEKPSDTVIQRAQKIKDFTFFIDVVSFVNMIYYHVYLHFNQRKNKEMSLHYLLLMLKNSKLLYPCILFLDKNNTEYDLNKHFGCSTMVIPKIELALHRIIQLLFSICSRFKAYRTMVRDGDPAILSLIDHVAEFATASMKQVIKNFDRISDLYYHAWVVSKCHAFICNKVLNMQPGPKEIISTTDVQFIATLKKEIGRDDSVLRLGLEDFQKIHDAVYAIHEVDLNAGSQSSTETPENNEMLNDKDKRWLEQIIQDINGQSSSIDNQMQMPVAPPWDENVYSSWNTVVNPESLDVNSIGNTDSDRGSFSIAPTSAGAEPVNKMYQQIAHMVPNVPVDDQQPLIGHGPYAVVNPGAVPNSGPRFEEFLFQYTSQANYGGMFSGADM